MPSKAKPHTPRHLRRARRNARQAYDRQRGSAAKRLYGARWQRLRKRKIAEHPWCQAAGCGRPVSLRTAHVDHVVPHRGDEELFWDEDNLQVLCETCHNRKTAEEDGGFGNPRKAES